ncbi:MAG: N6-L-threonylcarbamoyladenine synthase [Patescibacteria group bacterium]|jgi:N6-L-threonylcarbamoyladenine synthase
MTIILGIETTAHTIGVAVVKNGKVLSNVRDLFTTESGGLAPMEVKSHHEKYAPQIYKKAIQESGITENEIQAIALSNAPGLAPCLLAGMNFAKEKAKELNIGIIPVNHCVAHVEIGTLFGATDPVMLYASGANTQIIAYEGKKYRVFGETLDIGIGNFIDKFARSAGLGFPGGPKIEQLAKKYKGDLIELPYSIKGMDVSFSGIETKLRRMYSKKEATLEALSFALQETVFAMLVEASERALAYTGKKELLIGGGVACNSRLQEMCKIMCEARGVKFIAPTKDFLVDNGGMIAHLGEKMFKVGIVEKDLEKIDIAPRERTDDIEVEWK